MLFLHACPVHDANAYSGAAGEKMCDAARPGLTELGALRLSHDKTVGEATRAALALARARFGAALRAVAPEDARLRAFDALQVRGKKRRFRHR